MSATPCLDKLKNNNTDPAATCVSYLNNSPVCPNADDANLLESLVNEAICSHGFNALYIPRTLVRYDKLFGEDQSSLFKEYYSLNFFLLNNDRFGGDGDFLTRFGLEIRDEITVQVSQRAFHSVVSNADSTIKRPREGDLIYLPWDKRCFEITFVEDEQPFRQLYTNTMYEIRAKLFEFAGEEFETEIEEVDQIETHYQVSHTYRLTNGQGDYIVGEQVNDGKEHTAEVRCWDRDNRRLEVIQITTGDLLGETIFGEESGAQWQSTHEVDLAGQTHEDIDIITQEAHDLIDFSEKNPFSE